MKDEGPTFEECEANFQRRHGLDLLEALRPLDDMVETVVFDEQTLQEMCERLNIPKRKRPKTHR